MNSLTKDLLEGLLEEDKKVVALYGGGFKPPIGGHFEVVDEALKQYPEIDELIILVGSGERNGISQVEAILIWEIYQNYLPSKVIIQPSKSPIGDIYRFAKDNLQDTIYWIIGRREGADDDDKDIIDRAKGLEKDNKKYDNLNLKIITTQDEGMRGRNARAAVKKGKPYFTPFLPDILSKEDKTKVYNLVSPVLNENATYSKDIDYKQMIADLTNYMVEKDRNIEPLPKVEFVDGDSENAKDFLGKTAYYDPNTQTIVLYTEGRHPKDIVRSFSHEMVHHTQFLEDRLGDIQTTNTMEDDSLDKIEQEANLVGTMTFRNWTDSLNENTTTDLIQQFRQEAGPQQCNIYDKRDNCGPAALGFISWAESKGIKGLKRIDGYFKADIPVSSKRDFTREMKQEFLNDGGNWDNARERFEWISNSKYVEQWKYIPHYWVKDSNGKIYDPTGQQQFIDAGYAKDLNPNRYTLTDSLNEDKKVKDPFGINAYALELAKGLEEEINKKEYTIYSDMDGVLVDFNERFKRFSGGISPRDYEDKYGKEKFWDLIDNETGVRFWVGMPWMSDGKQLWNYIKNYDPTLLSSPSRSNSSRMGKRIWRKRNLPSTKLVLAQAAKKQNYANPNSILIDDYESNIDQWVKAGGIGILHTDTTSTIKKLKELGL